MEGALRIDGAIDLPSLRLERVVQDASGPFLRAHQVDRPSLIYIPPPYREAARGCFGEPESHRSFLSFGSASFVPAHVPVHIHSPGFASRTILVLRFDDRDLAELAGHFDGHDSALLMRCVDIRERRIIETIDRMAQEFERDGVGRNTILKGLGLVLLGEMARYLEESAARPAAEKGALADWQMRQISARVADDHKSPPCVDDLAAICGLGRRHFMRAFKARTGLTVMEWVERSTFDRATRLLESGTLSIKAISALLGYNHPGSFATAFARRFGLTPREWRHRHATRH